MKQKHRGTSLQLKLQKHTHSFDRCVGKANEYHIAAETAADELHSAHSRVSLHLMLVRNCCCCCCSQRTLFWRIAATKLGWPPQSSAKSAVAECKSKHQVTSRETELQHTHTPTLICAGRDNFKVISAVIGGGPTTTAAV